MANPEEIDYSLDQRSTTTTPDDTTSATLRDYVVSATLPGRPDDRRSESDDDDDDDDDDDSTDAGSDSLDTTDSASDAADPTKALTDEFHRALLRGNIKIDETRADTYTDNDDFGIVSAEQLNLETQDAAAEVDDPTETTDNPQGGEQTESLWGRAWNAFNQNVIEPAVDYVSDLLNLDFNDWFSGEDVDFESEEDLEGDQGENNNSSNNSLWTASGQFWDDLIGEFGEASRHAAKGDIIDSEGPDGESQRLRAVSDFNEASGYQMFENVDTGERVLRAGNNQVAMREVGGRGSGTWEGTMDDGRIARVDKATPGSIEIFDENHNRVELVEDGNYTRFVDTGNGVREISVRSGQPTREQIAELGNGNFEFRYQGDDGKPTVTTVTRDGGRTVTTTLQEGEPPRMIVEQGGQTLAFDGDSWASVDSNGRVTPMAAVGNMLVQVVPERDGEGRETGRQCTRTDMFNNAEQAALELARRNGHACEAPEVPPAPVATVTSADPSDPTERQSTTIVDNQRDERVQVTERGATIFDQFDADGNPSETPKYDITRAGELTDVDADGNPIAKISSEGFNDLVDGMFLDLEGGLYAEEFWGEECLYDGCESTIEHAEQLAKVESVSNMVDGDMHASISLVTGGNVDAALGRARSGFSKASSVSADGSHIAQAQVAMMIARASAMLSQVEHGYSTVKMADATGAFGGFDRTEVAKRAALGGGMAVNVRDYAEERGLTDRPEDRDRATTTV